MGTNTKGYITARLLPPEFLEANWRLWSFLLLLLLGIAALVEFPLAPFNGYTDPFYSPTVIILPLIGAFRLSCYAFRKDYHRHLFRHPENCALDERGDAKSRAYSGETGLFRIENLHRYFVYLAIAVIPFFFYDFLASVTYSGFFTLRFGSVLLLLDSVMITLYVFSCHSVRHLAGGGLKCYGCAFAPKQGRSISSLQSYFNMHHEALAWSSLILVIFVDLYLRALIAGWPIDATLITLHVVL
ncbi:MAG: hypothetical protein KGI00_03565 [Candidatus Micrarchaeota archaeon]|nr:hypothetical protein [Candidatus Micrarchaeota archaeon]MDE1849781.1 hypothetical protein [Candidatus Micrarchaeota archaeon]